VEKVQVQQWNGSSECHYGTSPERTDKSQQPTLLLVTRPLAR